MERTVTETEHLSMVMRLQKPGADIINNLTPWDANLIHMGGSLASEAVELLQAVGDKKETLEELGDFMFYLQACREAFGSAIESVQLENKNHDEHKVEIELCVKQLILCSGAFWDVVKRITIYRKPMDTPDSKYQGQTLREFWNYMLAEMSELLFWLIKANDLTYDEVFQTNITKLDKGRYSAGKYTNEAAQERKDKDAS